MNISIISGRVSKEINVKGKVGYFTLANDRDYPFNKDQNGNKVSNFLTVKVIGEKNVQRAQQYLTKGTAIIVNGHTFRDSWKEGNEYKEFNYILCEKWEWQQGGQNNEGESTPVDQGSYDAPQEDTHTSHPQSKPDDGFMDIPEGIEAELPFR
jgi:single-stranded DNA-binding protein